MKQTAVEWLAENLESITKKLFEQALEKEKKQQDKFAINFFNWCKSEVAKDLILDLIIVGEVSRNITTEQLLEIYKKEKGL